MKDIKIKIIIPCLIAIVIAFIVILITINNLSVKSKDNTGYEGGHGKMTSAMTPQQVEIDKTKHNVPEITIRNEKDSKVKNIKQKVSEGNIQKQKRQDKRYESDDIYTDRYELPVSNAIKETPGGGPVIVYEEELADFEVTDNMQFPDGKVEATEEEMDSFDVKDAETIVHP